MVTEPVVLPERARILVIRLSAMGDTLLTFPAVRELRARYPGARISYLTDAANTELLAGLESCDEVLALDRAALQRLRPAALWRTAKMLRALVGRRWDAVVDFQSFAETGILGRLTRAPVRVGRHYKQRACRWYTHWNGTPHGDQYMTAGHVETLRIAGMVPAAVPEGARGERTTTFFAVPEAARENWRAVRRDAGLPDGDLVAMFVGAAKDAKRWPAQSFAEVAANLLRRDSRLSFAAFAGPSEAAYLETLHESAHRLGCAARVHIMPSTSLPVLAAAFETCRATVSNDTGPMHLSVAVGTPTLGIFRWNDAHFIPPPPHRHILTPDGGTITNIDAAAVTAAAEDLLRAPGPPIRGS